MRDDDPLETWLHLREFVPDLADRYRTQVLYARRLRPAGDVPAEGEQDTPDDVAQVQDQYRRVLEEGGTGSRYLQEELLNLIAIMAEPSSIPFWLDLLEYKRPRDTFSKRRRTFIFAALAYLAIHRNSSAAYDTLLELTHLNLPEIREPAVQYVGRAYLEPERTPPPEIVKHLSEIATQDKTFGPRFWARMLLREIEVPIPLDNPGGVYVFKVKFKWAKRIYRSIAVRSEQTLDDLQAAFQRAIGWDNDHLYAFFMNGQVHDSRYMVAHPYLEDAPFYVDELALGELGLVRKHKFSYFFDYGDSHEFEVEVIDIQLHAKLGAYPMVVDKQGKAPSQYGWDDEEDMEEE